VSWLHAKLFRERIRWSEKTQPNNAAAIIVRPMTALRSNGKHSQILGVI
jgi:hypothetical protein